MEGNYFTFIYDISYYKHSSHERLYFRDIWYSRLWPKIIKTVKSVSVLFCAKRVLSIMKFKKKIKHISNMKKSQTASKLKSAFLRFRSLCPLFSFWGLVEHYAFVATGFTFRIFVRNVFKWLGGAILANLHVESFNQLATIIWCSVICFVLYPSIM